jgi:hypothetical protein
VNARGAVGYAPQRLLDALEEIARELEALAGDAQPETARIVSRLELLRADIRRALLLTCARP